MLHPAPRSLPPPPHHPTLGGGWVAQAAAFTRPGVRDVSGMRSSTCLQGQKLFLTLGCNERATASGRKFISTCFLALVSLTDCSPKFVCNPLRGSRT